MEAFASTLVARELPKPRVTKLLDRGEYDMPVGEPLQPGVPVSLGSMPEGAPSNRLGLADWLVSRDHPLVSRVLVNRIWQRVLAPVWSGLRMILVCKANNPLTPSSSIGWPLSSKREVGILKDAFEFWSRAKPSAKLNLPGGSA